MDGVFVYEPELPPVTTATRPWMLKSWLAFTAAMAGIVAKI